VTQTPVPGFVIAFHSSLAEPVTIAGAPRTLAILNATLAAIITLGLQVPWLGLPLGLGVHALAAGLTKRDPYLFEALRRHLKHKPHLSA
jgi:type IV secretion system protein VirB3